MFLSKYTTIPNKFLDLLTFKRIFVQADSRSLVNDQANFDEKVNNPNFLLYKTKLYEPANLMMAQASAPASAAPASAAPSSDIASLESRVAKLESDVAALQTRQ